jgi:hypothetical protein
MPRVFSNRRDHGTLISIKAIASTIVLESLVTAVRSKQEGIMSRYVIRFMKDVLGENGRQTEVCQSSMEIDANNKIDATELAKKNFCGMQNLADWSLHADRIQIVDADFPS